jgi:hypothetical protein
MGWFIVLPTSLRGLPGPPGIRQATPAPPWPIQATWVSMVFNGSSKSLKMVKSGFQCFFFFVNFQFQWIIIVLHQRFTIECAGWEVHFSDFFSNKEVV